MTREILISKLEDFKTLVNRANEYYSYTREFSEAIDLVLERGKEIISESIGINHLLEDDLYNFLERFTFLIRKLSNTDCRSSMEACYFTRLYNHFSSNNFSQYKIEIIK